MYMVANHKSIINQSISEKNTKCPERAYVFQEEVSNNHKMLYILYITYIVL